MNDRSNRISKLLSSQKSRASYIKAKLGVLVPAQIRAVRLKSTNPEMPYQRDLAREAEVHQSRISMFETPGAANITLETLAKIAAGLRVGVVVKFVPFHEMLRWENSFSPSTFKVIPRLESDHEFLNPKTAEGADFNGLGRAARPTWNMGRSESEDDVIAANAKKTPSSSFDSNSMAAGIGGR